MHDGYVYVFGRGGLIPTDLVLGFVGLLYILLVLSIDHSSSNCAAYIDAFRCNGHARCM